MATKTLLAQATEKWMDACAEYAKHPVADKASLGKSPWSKVCEARSLLVTAYKLQSQEGE